jgi:hypothetical protein
MAMTNVTVNDGATTPVSHTFVGQQAQTSPSSFAIWYEKSATLSMQAWARIKTKVALATSAKQKHSQQIVTQVPFVSVVDGVEVNKGTIEIFTTIVCPYVLNSTENLKMVWGLHKNVLAHAESLSVAVDQRPSA